MHYHILLLLGFFPDARLHNARSPATRELCACLELLVLYNYHSRQCTYIHFIPINPKRTGLIASVSEIIFNIPLYQESPITENRFLAQETPATINIYKDVTFIALWIKEPIVFRVKNQKIAASFKMYFKFMWSLAKEY